jgi:HSP20 family protein
MREFRKVWPLFVPEMPHAWRPLADVYRTRDGWLLKFDLAGVRLEDVTVSVRGRLISVSGIRRDTVIDSGSSYYSMEISYNRFERTIEMPTQLDSARLTLEARDGILLVRLTEEAKHTEGKHHA